MLRSSHYPYQGTALPHQQPQLHVRNPWIEQYESSNSSCGSRGTRHLRYSAPVNPSEWLIPNSVNMVNKGPILNQEVHPVVVACRTGSAVVSTAHGSSPAVSIDGTDSCGGHCMACETFCYYCLQVVFIVGIFTGVSLIIAGSVLRDHHKGDLMVLIYIGVLLTLVCFLLLCIHCCVRRTVRERKKNLRLNHGQRCVIQTPNFTTIPVQDYICEEPCEESCMETNLNDCNYSLSQRPNVNVTINPSYQAQTRMQTTSRYLPHTHDRRFHFSDGYDQQGFDWEGRPYQATCYRC